MQNFISHIGSFRYKRKLLTLWICVVLALLLPNCKLPDGANNCPCEHPGVASLSDDDLMELLKEAEEVDSEEYRAIEKEIKKGDGEYYFGHDRYDLGYNDSELWVIPDPPVQGCPFQVHWRIGYHWEECRMPENMDLDGLLELETGPFTETMIVSNPDKTLTGYIKKDYERETLLYDEFITMVYYHSGADAATLWQAKVFWNGEVPECWEGLGAGDVIENNSRSIQFEVICPCDDYEMYDLRIGNPAEINADKTYIDWTVILDWKPCIKDYPESYSFVETITITKKSNMTSTEYNPLGSVLMGSSTARGFPTAALDKNEEYILSVSIALTPADCDCTDLSPIGNNSFTYEFAL